MIFSKSDDQSRQELKIEIISSDDLSGNKTCHGNCSNCRKNQNNKTAQVQDLYKDFLSNL